ncbi:hypothetical protein FB451DRAFT_1183579 [Mycena latifolia]|nr:hypothetical protein FB451DRAFT_1183579 [Mycena latifolia]
MPEIVFDSERNPFYRDTDGCWLPYNGPLPLSIHTEKQQFSQAQHPAMPPPGGTPIVPRDARRDGPDSPIEHAFQEQYSFSLRPVSAPGPSVHPFPGSVIDPALVALPGGPDLDLTHGPTIAKARGLKAAEKARSELIRREKKRERYSDSEDESEPARKRGRPAGAGNYGKEDVKALFDLIEAELPVGQKGWKVIHRSFNKWARAQGRPKRSPKSLESKYKQYLKIKKPTGSATCPPEVKRMHELEDLINQRVGTRDLSDSEFDDGDSDPGPSDNDLEVVDGPVRTAVARRAPTPPLRLFDPDAQKAREEACSQRSFENTQIFTLSQQLRDSQAIAEGLRTQNTVLQNRIHDLERAHERDELKLELLQFTRGGGGGDGGGGGGGEQGFSRPRRRSYFKNVPGVERVRGKIIRRTRSTKTEIPAMMTPTSTLALAPVTLPPTVQLVVVALRLRVLLASTGSHPHLRAERHHIALLTRVCFLPLSPAMLWSSR